MAAFRRCVIALAVLAIFAGLASAQAPSPMTCSLSTLNTTARAESKTDLVSDLLMTCNGGTPLTAGTLAPTVNLTLTLPQNITSRIFSATTGASEALLLIDDPATVGGAFSTQPALVTGFGNNAVPLLCPTTSSGGCPSYAASVVVGPTTYQVMSSASTGAVVGTSTAGSNIYQGLVNKNSVTFFGIPVIPPGTTSTRTFRITNVRMDASAGGNGAVIGSLTVQGGAAPLISLNQTSATLATVQTGLLIKSSGLALSNCTAATYQYAGNITFTENFASAMRTRQVGGATQYSAQNGSAPTQFVPGSYFSESGYTPLTGGVAGGAPLLASSGATAGLADFGTRLKAVFNNLPSGARVFVSFVNNGAGTLANSTTVGAPNTAMFTANALTGLVGSSNTTSLAALITGAENVADTTVAPLATATTNLPASTITTGIGLPASGFPFVELTVSNNSATAIWEVLNANSAGTDAMQFDVFVTLPAGAATGTTTTNLSFAPTVTATTIPSFVDPNAATPANFFSISQCVTTLLFPYVTSASGFDTGIAIANTSTDTFGTKAQTGTCAFTLYGHPAQTTQPIPAAAFNPAAAGGAATGSVASGDVGVFALSQYVQGFSGYMIGVCNFQFAYGFAYIADWTSTIQSSAMGYLALQMPYGTTRTANDGAGLLP